MSEPDPVALEAAARTNYVLNGDDPNAPPWESLNPEEALCWIDDTLKVLNTYFAAQPPPEVSAGADVAAMAKELHTLLRNGKEFPYSDGEEKRHYELVVTRWLGKVSPTPDVAAVLAGLVEEMNAEHDEHNNGDHIRDYYVACGIRIARALVESALFSIRGPET